jgi:hypothetical protein
MIPVQIAYLTFIVILELALSLIGSEADDLYRKDISLAVPKQKAE